MPQHASTTPSQSRLARYLYVAALIRGRRVLEIGCGDGEGAQFLAKRGARSVLGLDVDGAGPGKPGKDVALRPIARSELVRPDGLRSAVGGTFDVIFLHATPELYTATFLAELRRLLSPGGHLIVAARSKEAFATDPNAIGYFTLFDGLTAAGLGHVAMLGQSPFFGAAVVPFGTNEPPLYFDDTLAPPENPEEYVALCGPPPAGPMPYQVVKLARPAMELTAEKSAAKSVEKVAERVEVPVPDPQIVSERDRYKSRVQALEIELEKRQQEGQLARAAQQGVADRLRALESEDAALKAAHQLLEGRLAETTAMLRAAEAQHRELSERLHQRDRGETEAAQAALLHERQMRELRQALEERDAFVAELEEQARELPRLQERLAAAEKLAEESQRSERQSRQRLAETEGLLLRARNELKERESEGRLSVELEARQRELEAERRELVLLRIELDQSEQTLAEQRAALEKEAQEVAKAKAAPAPQLEQAISERDVALSSARKELLSAQDRLAQLHSELEQCNRELKDTRADMQAQLERTRKEKTLALVAPTLGSGRRVESDGVPLLVGDMPTAPVAVNTAGGESLPAHQQELSQLRQRLAELTAENDRLKDKVTEAERETWKHMKARSEAEQTAAEVREDTVRKLRDARKLASVELTRAMEDATKKAVQLREELARTEAERKDALAQLKDLRAARDAALEQAARSKQELETVRFSATLSKSGEGGSLGASSSSDASDERQRALATLSEERVARQAAQQAADEAQLRVAELRSAVVALEQAMAETRNRLEHEQRRAEALEEELRQAGGSGRQQGNMAEQLRLQQELQQQARALAERTAERDALARLLSEVEREAAARSERARTMRVRLSEREREVEALRAELSDRERKIVAFEQQLPPSEEVARLEADLASTRRRIADLLEETARNEHHGDDAVATALRERARAVRASEGLEQATRERDEARCRISDLERHIKDALSENEQLRAELLRQGQDPVSTVSPAPVAPPAAVGRAEDHARGEGDKAAGSPAQAPDLSH